MNKRYNNFAFISYSHRDMSIAKWLQKKLEAFKLPTEIHNDIEAKSRYLRPIFRDQSDLNTGILGDELRKNLEESKYLILICSKNSAQSSWVSDEAKAFVEMGRLDKIIPVIIPDETTNERDLFPTYLREYFIQNPGNELLGVNIGEVGKEKAFMRVVSKMLNVSFDSLWKRHLRQKRKKIAIVSACSVLAIAMAYLFAIPISVTVNLSMQKADLPKGEDVTLIVDGGEYTSNSIDPSFEPVLIPGYKRFSNISIFASSQYYIPIDTIIPVGFGVSRDINLELRRDDTFAIFAGEVYDENMNPLSEVSVSVAGHVAVTNQEGEFSITLPLPEQRQELPILLEKSGYSSITRDDEIPGTSLKFIMH